MPSYYIIQGGETMTVKFMADKDTDTQRLPYRLREPFLASTELALFRILTEMMGSRYVICPKVALNDVFYIVRPNENVHFFNKFFTKSCYFLIVRRVGPRVRFSAIT